MRETIVNELVEAVKEIAGEGYRVDLTDVKKNNGVELTALVIRTEGMTVSPTIYIDEIVKKIEQKEMEIVEAAQKVFDMYEEHKNPVLGASIQELTNKEYILEHVEYQMVNAERNTERLEGVPSKRIADLAALYRVVIGKDDAELASFVNQNQVMEMEGISIEELDEAAARNTQSAGFTIKSMQQVAAEMMGMPEIEEELEQAPQMLVLTNRRKMNGANIILYKEQMEAVSKILGGDFFILPSSIHELLALPAAETDVDVLKGMVQEVNDNKVAPEEILGYQVYRYNSKNGEIEVAA